MCDKDFIDKGYKEYEPSRIDNECVVKCFQKRFDDDGGKKYFINAKKWDWQKYNLSVPVSYDFEFEVQLYSKDIHEPLNLTFFSGWSIDKVENYVESIWSNGMFDYYEKWGE